MRADKTLDKIVRSRERWARWLFWDNQRLVYNSEIYAARENGRMEGKEETARNMKVKGYKSEEIQAITGLSSEEIEKLGINS